MKTVLTLITAVLISIPFADVQAQNLGQMLTEIADGLKPGAFTDDFAQNKDSWHQQTQSLGAEDLDTSKEQVNGLVSGLNDEALDPGISEQLLSSLASAGNISDVGDVLGSLITGLNPSYMTQGLIGNKDAMLKGLSDL